MAGRSWCSTSTTFRSSTLQQSSRASGWSQSASRSSSKRWIGRRAWSCGHARSRPIKAAGTCFTHGGKGRTSSILPHFGVSGAGPRAWFGWPDIPQLDKLVTDWLRVTDQTKQKQLADEIQKVAFTKVPYVPWGEWVQPTAFQKNVLGVLKFGSPIFWNVKVG